MWKNNISAEVAINITKWNKKSSWLKLIKDFIERKNNE